MSNEIIKWIEQQSAIGTIGTQSQNENDLVATRTFSDYDLMIAMRHAAAMERGRVFRNVKEVIEAYNIPQELTWEEQIQEILDAFRAAVLGKGGR